MIYVEIGLNNVPKSCAECEFVDAQNKKCSLLCHKRVRLGKMGFGGCDYEYMSSRLGMAANDSEADIGEYIASGKRSLDCPINDTLKQQQLAYERMKPDQFRILLQ